MDEKPEDLLKNSEHSAYQIIQDIISKGSEQLYQNYIISKSVPYSIASTLNLVTSLLELSSQRFDLGESSPYEEVLEPIPCGTETWARNAVPVKRKFRMPHIESPLAVVPSDGRSHSSRRSVLGRQQKNVKNLKTFNNSIEEGIQPMLIPQDKSDTNDEEEDLRDRKEREMKRKKEDSDRLKKIKDEEAEKEKKLQKEADEIRKKVFTYDHQGKILFVNPVRVDSMPERLTEVKFVSKENAVEEVKQVKKKPARDFGAVKRLKTAPVHEKEWVRNATSVGPPLIEAIKLNPGVTFTDGARVRNAPVEESRTMSRKRYRQLYQPQQEIASNHSVLFPDKKSSSVSSLDSAKKGQSSKKDILDILPDYEDLPQDEIINKVSSAAPIRSATHGKIIQYGTGFKLDMSAGPTEKFNAEILNNRNWGVNPPFKEPRIIERLPKKPSAKQLQEVYGDIVKKPKDKPFITQNELWQDKGRAVKKPRDRPNIERVEKKTRMPPPPYGFTMINALPEINSLAVSVLSHKSLNKSEVSK